MTSTQDTHAPPTAGGDTVASRRGRDWLFVIGIRTYKEWPALDSPKHDAEAVRDVLLGRYGFSRRSMIELYDEKATVRKIRKVFKRLTKALHPEDTLLVYHAGHGFHDPSSGTTHWVAHEGSRDTMLRTGWISHADIRGYLANMQCRHALLVTDSCFSGDFLEVTRDIGIMEPKDPDAFDRIYQRRSRQVLTSGASEEVRDVEALGHSPFALRLLEVLRDNNRPRLHPASLYTGVSDGIRKQEPRFGRLRDSGDREGSYLFFLGDTPASTSTRRRRRAIGTGGRGSRGVVTIALAVVATLALAGGGLLWRPRGSAEPDAAAVDSIDSKQPDVPDVSAESQPMPTHPPASALDDDAPTDAAPIVDLEREANRHRAAELVVAARTLRDLGSLEAAKAKAEEAIALDPHSEEAKRLLGRLQEAVRSRRIAEQRQGDHKKWMDEGLRLRLAGKLREAAHAYRGAQAVAPAGDSSARSEADECEAELYAKRATNADDTGELEEAIGLYDTSLGFIDNPEVRRKRDACRQRLTAAREEKARRGKARTLTDAANAARAAGRLDEAVRRYREAASLGANVSEQLARAERESGEAAKRLASDRAIANVERAVKERRYRTAWVLLEEAAASGITDVRLAGLRRTVGRVRAPAREITGPLGVQLVLIPGGTFRMGSGEGQPDERPVHEVTVSPFYLGKYEIARAQWDAFEQGSRTTQPPSTREEREPVVGVTWGEAEAFCRRLMELDPSDATYRLPTEAEWEIAARGTQGRTYPWGDVPPGPRHANLRGRADRYSGLAPVGSFPTGATPERVEDLIGNAAEWCRDWYGKYSAVAVADPTGPPHGKFRVVRGCPFEYSGEAWSYAAARSALLPHKASDTLGFRVVRELTADQKPFARYVSAQFVGEER